MNSQKIILIVDDDPNILEVLEARLSTAGFKVLKAANAQAALRHLQTAQVELVVSDVKMPNMSGIELLHEILKINPSLPVIFLTAFGSIPEAVDAVKAGAVDYLAKPFDGRLLIEKINRQLQNNAASPHGKPTATPAQDDFFWGESPAMQELLEMVKKVAASNVNTLILGESGVGKEGIAKAIHTLSARKTAPYVIVDCGSTPPGILESELFGHTKGAFTNAIQDKKGLIEVADKGSLFLDEIGNISAEMQNRLLRFLENKKIRRVGSLEEKKVDCRVIAATNADLSQDIKAGKFRQDLYYRLRVVTLEIPPLRQRKQDIPALAKLFIEKYVSEYNLPPIEIPPQTMDWLKKYHWPGNVRELKNSLEAGVVLCRNSHILPSDLQLQHGPTAATNNSDSQNSEQFTLENNEKEAILRALKKTHGIQKDAAELLKISRRSIHYKIKKYNIQAKGYKSAK